MADCVHHWVIDYTEKGTCKKCDKVHKFTGSQEKKDWWRILKEMEVQEAEAKQRDKAAKREEYNAKRRQERKQRGNSSS